MGEERANVLVKLDCGRSRAGAIARRVTGLGLIVKVDLELDGDGLVDGTTPLDVELERLGERGHRAGLADVIVGIVEVRHDDFDVLWNVCGVARTQVLREGGEGGRAVIGLSVLHIGR
jgi:hypothetical protein